MANSPRFLRRLLAVAGLSYRPRESGRSRSVSAQDAVVPPGNLDVSAGQRNGYRCAVVVEDERDLTPPHGFDTVGGGVQMARDVGVGKNGGDDVGEKVNVGLSREVPSAPCAAHVTG
jgi:hypothetical protein